MFRPSPEVTGITNEALARDDVEIIWLQIGIHDDEAVARAEEANLTKEDYRDADYDDGLGEVFSERFSRPDDEF